MDRRLFLGRVGTAAAATLPLSVLAANAPDVAAAPVELDRAKWSAPTRQAIEALIARHGKHSAGYTANRRPYAVFDWDNTCIMNDTEEALFMYQINKLAFRLTPEDFGTIIRKGVPAGAFAADYKNAEGQSVTLDAITADLDADYAYLHANYRGMKGSKTLEEITADDHFIDFRAKLYYLYEAINDTHGPNIGYPWVIYFFANMTRAEVAALAEESNDNGLSDQIAKLKLASAKSLPGKAGVVSVSHTRGLRLTPEIANLMEVLRRNGIDIYVSTASLEDVVRVFASLPKYGYHVAPENVIGLRLDMNGDVYQSAYRKNWPLNWGPGKSLTIRSELIATKGYGPIFVAGDSDGDYDMLRDFPETEVGLLVNRLKKGNIGSLCKLAAEQRGSNKPRFVMQGRFEVTGQWLPREETLKLGQKEPKLLA
ncbi:HAD family hydrolase [Noviherbaspirillum saxi]|uniref:phosphoserine phosphatase n=1 Tax=Noviherbaspirillum saxi TaxID=2320863 RepID=A0A3A3FKM4_9BURK|nr:HAD family hydrolase [Noviherbaspirillum saxi]RJF92052.1 haloacid dehalogenase-like hydrolase [Noviherbaspirillum saxi]